ncbi:MAG TPA: type II secretion system protein GspJ [Candidatus Binataceae bacterium]
MSPKSSLRIGRQGGFTLIELMLAVGLLGLILVLLTASFAAVAHSKIHGENRLAIEDQGRAILFQMSKELTGAVNTPFEPSKVLLIGTGHQQGGRPLDSLVVSTLDAGHRRAINGFAAEQTVVYDTSVPSSGAPGSFLLTRSERSSLLVSVPNTANNLPPIVLADNVLSLHLRYFDGSKWNETWDSANAQTIVNGAPLPIAVMIDLTLASPSGRPINFSTEVTLPMAVTAR